MAERIGFVGVGRMGANMARRLAESGYKVTALYDINKKSAQSLARELNAEACSTLARVTELSDVVITVVTDDKAMRKIFAAKGDSLLVGAAGRVFINCATVSPEIHVDIEALSNLVMNINTAGLAEGLALGDALNLNLTMLREIFSQTGANSRVLVTDGEDMQNREHSCFFSAAHAAKDSGIALSLAREKALNLPLAAAAFKQYTRMTREGLGELDKSG